MSARTSSRPGALTRVFGSQWFVSVLAVIIAFAIGAILIALSGASVRRLLRDVPRPIRTRTHRPSSARSSR